MTLEFEQKTNIHAGMAAICNTEHNFPQQYVDKAKALLEKWESEYKGAAIIVKRESASESGGDVDTDSESAGRAAKRKKTSDAADIGILNGKRWENKALTLQENSEIR